MKFLLTLCLTTWSLSVMASPCSQFKGRFTDENQVVRVFTPAEDCKSVTWGQAGQEVVINYDGFEHVDANPATPGSMVTTGDFKSGYFYQEIDFKDEAGQTLYSQSRYFEFAQSDLSRLTETIIDFDADDFIVQKTQTVYVKVH